MLTSGLGGSVRLLIDIAPDVWPVIVDVGELEIALVNLVVNARDAMPDGGTVTITASNVTVDEGEIACRPATTSPSPSQDTGVGIPPDVLGNVFDPFFTTKPVGKGTGLGLSQVYGFAHQAGGTVRSKASSDRARPSPCYCRARPSTSIDAETGETGAEQLRTGTVLLVEDNPEVASASTGLLEQLGYSVRWVPNAEAALQEIEKDGIDLVFSDIVMPGRLDGLGLARIIKQKHPGPADPARDRLQRGGAERSFRLSDPSQALSDARAEPRARRADAGLVRHWAVSAGVASRNTLK